jgi:hypothetical protein
LVLGIFNSSFQASAVLALNVASVEHSSGMLLSRTVGKPSVAGLLVVELRTARCIYKICKAQEIHLGNISPSISRIIPVTFPSKIDILSLTYLEYNWVSNLGQLNFNFLLSWALRCLVVFFT